MTIEYKPGDLILSYKAPNKWNLIARFFNWKVKRHAIKTFGEDCIFPECNHVRIVVGKVGDPSWGFHWTAPTARFCKIEPWMSDPEYSMVMTDKRGPLDPDDLMNVCLEHDGSIYDIGDLIDTGFSLPFSFNFGKKNFFCSGGAFMLRKLMGRIDPCPTAVERVPPCLWANLPELFTRVNERKVTDNTIMSPEPARRK